MWGFFFFYRMKILRSYRLNWSVQPLSRFLLLFFIGLLIAYYFTPSLIYVALALLLFLAAFFTVYFSNRLSKFPFKGWLLSLLILVCGSFTGYRYSIKAEPVSIQLLNSKQFYVVRINSEPIRTDSLVSFEGDFFHVLNDSALQISNTPISVKAKIFNCLNSKLCIGQYLLVRCRLYNPKAPIVPGGFDYSEYLRRKGIYTLTNFSTQDFIDFHLSDFCFQNVFIEIRQYLIESLNKNGLKSDELAIASALLLGARTEISDELNQAYSQSGITHILAVSGMHVGLVFLAIGFLLKQVKNKIYVCILSLVFLWGYACLTGLSPSVVRAAWMFSFIACGKLFRSGHQKWNSISASALLMLILDPYIWLDAGFQLSFSAVWGIVSFGKLPEQFISKFKWRNYLFEAAWISCVAQLCTLPVSLYLFGKFPVYFLLANLIVVPLSTLLTYLGIICFVFIPISILSFYFCFILDLGIKAMNFIAKVVADLPSSTLDGIHFHLVQSLFLGFLIYVLASNFLFPKTKIKILVLSSFFLSIINWVNFLKPYDTQVLYHSNLSVGLIHALKHSTINYVFYGLGSTDAQTLKSFGAIPCPIIESVFVVDQRIKSGNFMLQSDIHHFQCVLFIDPNIPVVNPFQKDVLNLPLDYVFLKPGGSFKLRQLWRLAAIKKQVKLIELNRPKMNFQGI